MDRKINNIKSFPITFTANQLQCIHIKMNYAYTNTETMDIYFMYRHTYVKCN